MFDVKLHQHVIRAALHAAAHAAHEDMAAFSRIGQLNAPSDADYEADKAARAVLVNAKQTELRSISAALSALDAAIYATPSEPHQVRAPISASVPPSWEQAVREAATAAAQQPVMVKIDADLAREAGMDGNLQRLLQAGRNLDRR